MKKILSILLCLLIITPVSAIPDDKTLDFYDTNDIWYYDPSGCSSAAATTPAKTTTDGSKVTWIGDSYSDGYESEISEKLKGVDFGPNNSFTRYSKHIAWDGDDATGQKSGLTIIKENKSTLRSFIVFALGTNLEESTYSKSGSEKVLKEVLDAAGTDKTVLFVTPYTHDNVDYQPLISAMKEAVNSNKNALLADWEAAAKDHPEYFDDASDTGHPNDAGHKIWVDTIVKALATGNTSNTLATSSGIDVTVSADSLPAETVAQLEAADVKGMAEKNMERYLYAEKETGLPWQILATLHWREAGMGSNLSISNGEELYEHVNVDGVHVSADPNQDAKEAAEHFIEMGKSVYGVDVIASPSLENYAMAFLAYNRGNMYKAAGATWDQSPYVMNGLDEDHINMRFIHADSWYGSTQYNNLEGMVNTSPGALAVLTYLGGATGSLTASLSSSDNCPTTPRTCGSTLSESAFPGYKQNEWDYVDSYGYDLASAGCGPTSYAEIITALTGQEVTPIDVAKETTIYNYVNVSMVDSDRLIAEKYNLEFDYVSVSSRGEMTTKIKEYLSDGWLLHTSGNAGKYGCSGARISYGCVGHYISLLALRGDNEVLVSNMVGDGRGWGNQWYTIDELFDMGLDLAFSATRQKGGGGNSTTCGDGTLVTGGFTDLSDAEAFMKDYSELAKTQPRGSGEYLGAYIYDAGCPFGTLSNCVAFSQWFINKYTTTQYMNTSNGNLVVTDLLTMNFKDGGTTPAPYAIFSQPGPSSAGHTGVILGVNKEKNTIIIGEASCSLGRSSPYYWPHAVEYSLDGDSEWTNGYTTYAYTDGLLKGGL